MLTAKTRYFTEMLDPENDRVETAWLTGESLRAWRAAAGWTQKDLANRSGVHVQTVKYWERQEIVSGHAPNRFRDALAGAAVARPSEIRYVAAATGLAQNSGGTAVQLGKCGAKTRKGNLCQVRALPGKRRCKFHGGMSTGPKSADGRRRISERQSERWRAFRVARSLRSAGASGTIN